MFSGVLSLEWTQLFCGHMEPSVLNLVGSIQFCDFIQTVKVWFNIHTLASLNVFCGDLICFLKPNV